MKEEEICLNCIRWEGRVVASPPLWKARCSQIGEDTEQTGFCIFWVRVSEMSESDKIKVDYLGKMMKWLS